MTVRFDHSIAVALLALGLLAACSSASRTSTPEASAPSVGASAASADSVRQSGGRDYTDADVRFVQGMIAHHGQALTMAAMVPSRTRSDAMLLLAERIDVSQRDEIAAMQRWLEQRGEEVPAAGGHQHVGAHVMMPGMLTDAELAMLAAASGPEFDRLFLELMIRHHEGALIMVKALFASQGAGQQPELFVLASEIDADQRAEIRRMQAMLAASPGASLDR